MFYEFEKTVKLKLIKNLCVQQIKNRKIVGNKILSN